MSTVGTSAGPHSRTDYKGPRKSRGKASHVGTGSVKAKPVYPITTKFAANSIPSLSERKALHNPKSSFCLCTGKE